MTAYEITDPATRERVREDYLREAKDECRASGVKTDLPAPFCRHYVAREVAAQFGGQWVGWTYFYGGGKHAEPEAVPWIEDAYFLDCVEEEKVVTVRTFTKKETECKST